MEYHKIETLFERDPQTHKVYPDKLKNAAYGIIKTWQFTEKIDGTNIRIIWDGELRFGGKTDKCKLTRRFGTIPLCLCRSETTERGFW